MIFIYRILINLIFFLSPIIILVRLIKKKENIKRFREKLCFFSEKKLKGKVIWFHGASVGELQSIVPLIEKIGNDNTVKQILITSNTLSSSKVIQKLKIKKVTHQFFPVDTNFLSKKFLDYWNPSSAFFIDSEIWPNMIFNLKKRNIPINLINGRITKKTFKRWKKVSKFSKSIFSKLDLCLSSSLESKKYLKKLGAQKVKFIGNLKFSQSEKKNIKVNSDFKKFIFSKRIWCASSTHENEEEFCGSVHKELNKKYKNLLTVIIPRHVERADIIKKTLENMDLKVHLHEPRKKIDEDTNIYIVNAYGQTKSFYDICKNVFLGGSLVNRGGQNPLEAARYGCNILHGPNVLNFKEVYEFLKKNNISIKVSKKREMFNHLSKLFMRKKPSRKIKNRLNLIGQKILDTTYKEVKFTY